MAQQPDHLRYDIPIVDPRTGTPTVQFQKLWQAVLDKLADYERRLAAGGL